MRHARLGHFGRAGQHVVGQRRGERLGVLVVGHFFIQRRAYALCGAAKDLAVHHHGIDHGAAVLNDDVIEDLDVADLGVDRDRDGVTGITEGARILERLVAGGGFEPARVDIRGQQLRLAVPDMRQLLQRHFLVGSGDAHIAVGELQVSAGHLHQARCNVAQAFFNLAAGGGDSAAGHHGAARTPGAGRVGRQRRVAVDQAHAIRVYAQHLVGHLRQRGLQALAVRMRAYAQLQHAIGRQTRLALLMAGHHRDAPAVIDRRAMRALLAKNGQSDADFTAVGLAGFLPRAPFGQVYHRHCAAQGLRIIAAVEIFVGDVGVRHGLGRHQVQQPHLPGLAPGLARNGVHQQLDGKAHAGAGHAAIRQDGRLVGRYRPGVAAVFFHAIRAGQDGAHLRALEAG